MKQYLDCSAAVIVSPIFAGFLRLKKRPTDRRLPKNFAPRLAALIPASEYETKEKPEGANKNLLLLPCPKHANRQGQNNTSSKEEELHRAQIS